VQPEIPACLRHTVRRLPTSLYGIPSDGFPTRFSKNPAVRARKGLFTSGRGWEVPSRNTCVRREGEKRVKGFLSAREKTESRKPTQPTPRSGNWVMCPTRTPSFRNLTCQERWLINSWNGGDGNSLTFSCFVFCFFSPPLFLYSFFLFFVFFNFVMLVKWHSSISMYLAKFGDIHNIKIENS